MIYWFLIAAAISFIVCFGLTPPLIRLSHRFGWLDLPKGRKRHKAPTPFTGGWVIFLSFWIGLLFCYLLIPEIRQELGARLWVIFAAHAFIFAAGILDDYYHLRPITKLLLQTVAASILFFSGLGIHTIYVPFTGSFPLGMLAYPVTILWALVIVNAINIIDGMDGLAGGLALIAAAGLLYTAIVIQVHVVAALTLALIGTLSAFLYFNFPQARIFMGDSGTNTLGFIFAVTAIYCPIKSYTVVAMLIPLLALGVPLIELGVTFTRRLVTGRSIIRADRGHLYHFLLRRGFSQTRTVLTFWGIALVLQFFVFTLFLFDRRIVFSILVLFMLVLAGWFLLLARREVK